LSKEEEKEEGENLGIEVELIRKRSTSLFSA
jgi:hypothetical protein